MDTLKLKLFYVSFFVSFQIRLIWFTFLWYKQKSRLNPTIQAALICFDFFVVIPLGQNSNLFMFDLRKLAEMR